MKSTKNAAIEVVGMALVMVLGAQGVIAADSPPAPWPQTWFSVSVSPWGYVTNTIMTGLPANSLWTVSLGLRMLNGPQTALIGWGLAYAKNACPGTNDQEIMNVREWYPGQAHWQSIKFMTFPSGSDLVCWWYKNDTPETFTLEYSIMSQRVLADYSHQRLGETLLAPTATLPAFSGMTHVFTLGNLAVRREYFFTVDVNIDAGPFIDETRQMAFLWECSKSPADPSSWPAKTVRASGHVAYSSVVSNHVSVSVFLVTLEAGASCKLFVNNWDDIPHFYLFNISYYLSQWGNYVWVERNGESENCQTLVPGQTADSVLMNLDDSTQRVAFFGWAYVRLSGALGQGDFAHNTSWYVSYGLPSADSGLRQGYQLRDWTNFGSEDPRAEGTVIHGYSLSGASLWLHIKNTDSSSHEYCSAFVNFGWFYAMT